MEEIYNDINFYPGGNIDEIGGYRRYGEYGGYRRYGGYRNIYL